MTALAIPLLSFYSSNAPAPAVHAAGEEREVTVELTYYCESVTNFDMPVKITAIAPTWLEPGEVNYSGNSYTEVTIPADVVNILRDILQVEAISGTVTRFDVSSTNTNKTINVAELYDIEFPYTEIPASGGITVRVPETGGFDVGPFEAGESGEMVFKAGQIDTNLISHGILGDTALPAECSPKPGEDNTIVTIPIGEPGDPTDPDPTDPTDPDPTDPTDPDPTDPTDPDPTDPTDPGPTDPTDPGPTDPTDPTDPDPTDPTDPDPTDPTDPGDDDDGDDNGDGKGKGTGTGDKGDDGKKGGLLPKTATSTPFLILLGTLIALAGGALVFFRKKKVMTE
ncbi:DUF6801 domain-containing protein [Pueribacillus sp. YX66]|uniref:DUF6801 domain-containing protein n=1 Tax=Pueribacillus sp. YX66 TaxID=3229242 RepID=UPI00358CEEF1